MCVDGVGGGGDCVYATSAMAATDTMPNGRTYYKQAQHRQGEQISIHKVDSIQLNGCTNFV